MKTESTTDIPRVAWYSGSVRISEKVKKKLQELPDQPGVYLMRDRNRRVIYIGKATSLRNRVRTYFRQGTLRSADPKLRGLIRSVHDFDYLVVRNEAEATLTARTSVFSGWLNFRPFRLASEARACVELTYNVLAQGFSSGP